MKPLCALSLVAICAGSVFGQTLGEAPRRPDNAVYPRAQSQSTPAAANTNWIDNTNRANVRASYLNTWLPTIGVATAWSGDVLAGIWGTTSQPYKDTVAARINWIRALAGVPPSITLDPVESEKDQEAAMMMSANNQLNHNPPSTWTNYTANGAMAAANSNLCLGWILLYDPGCALSYMQDFGSDNYFAGHRRWILYPQTQIMGTGDVAPNATPLNANALWVFDGNFGGPRPATRDNFVAFPPPGFVPYTVVYPRWSFAYPNADFSQASVSMTQNGSAIPVRMEPLANGYGENTLVFVPNNLDAENPYTPVRPSADTPYQVTIANVLINGAAQTFNYTVTVFDPAAPPVTVTVSSNPSNLGAFVDSTFVNSPATFNWTPGDMHNLSAAIYSQTGNSRIAFSNWSDGAGIAHGITVPATNTNLVVTYATQYLLTATASPSTSGSIALNPAGTSGFYNSGTSVQVTAVPNIGFTFTGFTGDLSGATNPQSIVMNAAHNVTAMFACAYSLNAASANPGAAASTGTVALTAGSGCAWSVTGGAAWLTLTSPSSGTGSATISYSVALNNSNAQRSASFTIGGRSFTVTQAGMSTGAPFGVIDTPANNITGVSGAIGVTGWALSLAGIQTIGVWRDPIGSEPVAANGLVFLLNATIVPNSRPDVAQAYPGYPNNNAGWGAQILTNTLPNSNGAPGVGNGTYRVHVIVTDLAGQTVELGVRSMTVDNAHSLIPFGAIDTPTQGGTASGTAFVNFGWALTPIAANLIPKDGSTIWVYIDNQPVGHPVYNNYRSDIATIFPGLQNSNGAVGYYNIDTTKLSNGLHTISWSVTDSAGNTQGIGSRFFNVQN